MTAILITALILCGIVYLQGEHYKFLRGKEESRELIEFYTELDRIDKKLKEFDEYKKRVDALTLRAGFKL